MRVLQSTNTDPGGVLGAALSNIRKLAEQVVCYSDDMVNAPDRPDLKRLPAALFANSFSGSLLPYDHEDLVCISTLWLQIQQFQANKWKRVILHSLANANGYTVQYDKALRGPQIMWLQSGSFGTEENQICFCVIIQRPKSRDVGLEEEEEPVSKCSIKIPVAQGQFVKSNFQCQVGDIIVLERGEELWIDDSIERYGICFLATLYKIEWKEYK